MTQVPAPLLLTPKTQKAPGSWTGSGSALAVVVTWEANLWVSVFSSL